MCYRDFTSTRSLVTRNSKFNFSFLITSELVDVNPDNTLTRCSNLYRAGDMKFGCSKLHGSAVALKVQFQKDSVELLPWQLIHGKKNTIDTLCLYLLAHAIIYQGHQRFNAQHVLFYELPSIPEYSSRTRQQLTGSYCRERNICTRMLLRMVWYRASPEVFSADCCSTSRCCWITIKFWQNAGKQCVAMSLTAIIHN